jgi:trehalose synthase
MLETVDVGTQDLNLYELSEGAEAVAQLRELAAPLEGARILHVNATPLRRRGRRDPPFRDTPLA